MIGTPIACASWMRRGLLAPVAAALLSLTSCAYSFRGSSLPGYVKTVAVPSLGNQTLDPGIAQEVTTAISDRFVQDARLKLAGESQAQASLEGQVVRYENKVNNYDANQSPRDYIVVVTLAVRLQDQVKSRELWKDDQLTATSVYTPGGVGDRPSTEQAARQEAVQKIASDVVTRTLEQW